MTQTLQFDPARVAPGATAHIFDVDHTLTRHSTGALFAREGQRAGLFRWRQLATLPYYYLRYRLGALSLGAVTREITPLRGYSREELEDLAYQAWENRGQDDLFPPVRAYLAACRRKGAPVILATSTFDLILAPLREALGIDQVVSSKLEFDQEGFATGWLVGGPCYAEEKAARLKELLKKLELSPRNCAFYSDSHHDLPALRAVGSPVAVNPDRLLARRARLEGWPVIRWDKPWQDHRRT
ncbi:HAD-superfamily subfamily IB hydrolase, TIGR01490 [Alkalispirochaeta americana]|uniref:HAD-superfamily subfamily IB hydrolase, TIGR01490 n=1 Tax=Alkalispirochaeta americana TaxID=159291 RepID=A0A1N6TNQ1_9SPIO|nr:HAD-IB family hydrolase [Alkalispirochaeta americana]SIQ54965.1 HAD-superfamily subfamily IB hydrolase, TIGR01490 [Alkalispirochaeta americana]